MQNETEIQTTNGFPLEIIDKEDHIVMKYIRLTLEIKNVTFDEVQLIIGKRLLVIGVDVAGAKRWEQILMKKGELIYERDRVILNDVAIKNFLIVYLLQRLHGISLKKAYEITDQMHTYHREIIVDLLETKCPINDYAMVKFGDEVIKSDRCEERLKAIHGVIKAIYKALTAD